jgi:trimethylamine--corrinoid protein Co-methyltransferase
MWSQIKRKSKGIIGGNLNFLNKAQIKEIDYASKEVLWHTGVVVPHKEALKILDEAGAVVDYNKNQVWIPHYLVEESLRKAPKSFRIAGRDPRKYLDLSGDRVYFIPYVGPSFLLDLKGNHRGYTIKDAQDILRLTDALPNLDVAAGGGIYGATPVEEMNLPLRIRRANRILRSLEFAEKPIDITVKYAKDREYEMWMQENPREAAIDNIRMGIALRGSLEELQKMPMGWGRNEPVSPLTHSYNQVERMLVYSRCGLPIIIGPEPMMSATAPATVAGTVVLWNAEALSCLVIGQMAADPKKRPPVLYQAISGSFDQRAMQGPSLGSPETALIIAASVQVSKYYGLPCTSLGDTESKLPDAQSGYETVTFLITAALSGVNYCHFAGALAHLQGFSLEKVVLDDDMIMYVKRLMQGVEVTDETLAVEAIEAMGPRGTFLTSKHTLECYEKEMTFPNVFERGSLVDWQRKGSKSARERANKRACKILKDHWVEPLDPDIKKRLVEYVSKIKKEAAHKFYLDKG